MPNRKKRVEYIYVSLILPPKGRNIRYIESALMRMIEVAGSRGQYLGTNADKFVDPKKPNCYLFPEKESFKIKFFFKFTNSGSCDKFRKFIIDGYDRNKREIEVSHTRTGHDDESSDSDDSGIESMLNSFSEHITVSNCLGPNYPSDFPR